MSKFFFTYRNENEIIVVALGNFEPGGAYFEETEKLVKRGFEKIK